MDREIPREPPVLEREPNWRPFWRRLAIVMWSGFLGASLLLLALLVNWDHLGAAREPGLGLLAGAFGLGWLVTVITATMALSLAAEPRGRLRPRAERESA